MYTGITRGTHPVTFVDRRPDNMSFEVDLGKMALGLEIGASVSIDGVCQTVVGIDAGRVRFDAIRETLECSTLGGLTVGRRVSVERSARIGDEIGGHELAGHVSGTGRVRAVTRDGSECSLSIEVPSAWKKTLFEKGFVAVDGSSLTVGDVAESDEGCTFRVHLIPETIRTTHLGRKRVGDRVNIELDARTVAIVETVERFLQAQGTYGRKGHDRRARLAGSLNAAHRRFSPRIGIEISSSRPHPRSAPSRGNG